MISPEKRQQKHALTFPKQPIWTPEGILAGKLDPVMLMKMWLAFLQTLEGRKLRSEAPLLGPAIEAFMGKPTFPIEPRVPAAAIKYFKTLRDNSIEASRILSSRPGPDARNVVSGMQVAADYNQPKGDFNAKALMATALQEAWYPYAEIKPKHILFTVGGVASLDNASKVINKLYPGCRIITPFPCYSLYPNRGENNLYPIDTMKLPGYRLSAEAVRTSIEEAIVLGETDGKPPKAFILCDPSNPMGTLLKEEEVKAIVAVLEDYPDMYVVLDTAYSDMVFTHEYTSPLKFASEALKRRMIIMHSATKMLSAAGERLALTLAFDEKLMTLLTTENVAKNGHAPVSSQLAFAEAMKCFTPEKVEEIVKFYLPQVRLVEGRIREMGASLPDPDYQTEGSFYALADLSDLLGTPLPECTERVFNRTGAIKTDVEIVYALMFEDNIAIAPMSYLGADPKLGLVRITCSGGDKALNNLLNRLETRLAAARTVKKEQLLGAISKITDQLAELNADPGLYKGQVLKIENLTESLSASPTALELKKLNTDFKKIRNDLNITLIRANSQLKEKSATRLQALWKGYMGRRLAKQVQQEERTAWKKLVDKTISHPTMRQIFYGAKVTERAAYLAAWADRQWKFFVDTKITNDPTVREQFYKLTSKERTELKDWKKAVDKKVAADPAFKAMAPVLYVAPSAQRKALLDSWKKDTDEPEPLCRRPSEDSTATDDSTASGGAASAHGESAIGPVVTSSNFSVDSTSTTATRGELPPPPPHAKFLASGTSAHKPKIQQPGTPPKPPRSPVFGPVAPQKGSRITGANTTGPSAAITTGLRV